MGVAEDIEKDLSVQEQGLVPNDVQSPSESSSPASITHDANKRPECFSSTFQECLFVLTCTMAIGTSSFTIGATTPITARIGEDLHMTNAEVSWINGSCALGAGAFLMLFARVADLFGRRSMFIVSMGVFSVVIMGVGFSRTPLEMDVLMGFTGLMTAASVPPAQGILGVVYNHSSRRKNAVFACFSAGNPLGFVIGMISSGVATEVLSWRASFFWIAIIYACFTVIAIFIVPNDPTEKQALTWETLKNFDIPGVLLIVAGIAMFSSGLSLGGNAREGWKTPYVIALLVVGIACLAAFVVWECYCERPLIPMSIFKDRNFSLLLLILLFGFMGFTTSSFWVSLYLQRVWHSSALKTAVYLLPMAVSGTLVNVVAGMVLHRISNRILMAVGAIAYTISFLLLAVAKSNYSYWALFFPSFVLVVMGADFEFNVTNMYVMSTMSRSQQSVAGGLFQTVTRLCGTIGFGISTALFNAVQDHPSTSGYYSGDPIEPYSATFWFAFGVGAASLLLLPWLTIGTQGHHQEVQKDEGQARESRSLKRNENLVEKKYVALP